MATYKLIQDIEAEDHILGPLTLRQFVFALVTAFMLYVDFLLVIKHAAFMLVLFGPPTLLVGFFAFPFGGDQPTEVWALAKVRFWFKPHQRLWNQTGLKELVTITAPKKVDRVYTDGLSQGEVKSRLKALASTIDSRGWAVKNVTSTYSNPMATGSSDRLIDLNSMAVDTPEDASLADADILDDENSAVAQQFDAMINQSAANRHQSLITQMSSPQPVAPVPGPAAIPQATPADYWFMQNDGHAPAQQIAPIAAANPTAEEAALVARAKAQQTASTSAAYGNMHTLQPLGAQTPQISTTPVIATLPKPVAPDPEITLLAGSNDLSVATIQREANKKKGEDEVVINLHS